MSRATILLLCSTLALVACATAGDTPADPVDAANNNDVDAPPPIPMADAAPGMADAPPVMPPDAAPPMPDAPLPCTMQQLLIEPGFDSGGGAWEDDPGGLLPIITQFPPGAVVAHSPPAVAAMGTLILTSDELYQELVMPAGTVSATLSGQRWIETGETGSNVYDSMTVSIRDTTGAVLANLRTLSNLDASAGWVALTEPFPQPFAGQTIRVQFDTSNDFADVTTFSVDSLRLDAMVCP